MPGTILVCDDPAALGARHEGQVVLSPAEYLTDPAWGRRRRVRVINLCRAGHGAAGPEVSLLAAARGHAAIPSADLMLDATWRRKYGAALPELYEILADVPPGRQGQSLALPVMLGQAADARFAELGRRAFDRLRAPLLYLELAADAEGWQIERIEMMGWDELPRADHDAFHAALAAHLRGRWWSEERGGAAPARLAILHDPDDADAPSDMVALERFAEAARRLGMETELITRNDFARLSEFDALFIREDTDIDHHSWRFARRAAREGLALIDPPDSILKCAGKAFLSEALAEAGIPHPATRLTDRAGLKPAAAALGFPLVVKLPGNSRDRGVFLAEDAAALERLTARLWTESDFLILQQHVPGAHDWRVGVIGGRPVFACRQDNAPGHWKPVARQPDGGRHEGAITALPVDALPQKMIETAVAAALLVGDGLLGVDLREGADGAPLVIGITDSPRIIAGVQDQVSRDALYLDIMGELARRISRGSASPAPRTRMAG